VIDVIRVLDSRCETSQGVHAGMPVAEVEKRYGRLLRIFRSEIESREFAEFEKRPNWADLQVTGLNPDGALAALYPSGKSCASKYAPGARIQSIWISAVSTSVPNRGCENSIK